MFTFTIAAIGKKLVFEVYFNELLFVEPYLGFARARISIIEAGVR